MFFGSMHLRRNEHDQANSPYSRDQILDTVVAIIYSTFRFARLSTILSPSQLAHTHVNFPQRVPFIDQLDEINGKTTS